MQLLKRIRRKMQAMHRRPKVYMRYYFMAFFLRWMLLFFEVVLLRLFVYVPLRLADMSPKELLQYMRKVDFHAWIWFKRALWKCLEVKSWVQGLGNFSSLPEILKHLNTRLFAWLQCKWASFRSFLRNFRSFRRLPQHFLSFLKRHFRNHRMLRRGTFRMILGIILAKLMTFFYIAFAGAAMVSVWGFDCLFMILGTLQIVATKIAHILGRMIEHHIYLVQQGSDFAAEKKQKVLLKK